MRVNSLELFRERALNKTIYIKFLADLSVYKCHKAVSGRFGILTQVCLTPEAVFLPVMFLLFILSFIWQALTQCGVLFRAWGYSGEQA